MARTSPTATSFQSTHPVRGATLGVMDVGDSTVISIHAPREGCDPPRKPSNRLLKFQSTHPVRGAT